MNTDRFKFRVWDNLDERYTKDMSHLRADGVICYDDGHPYCNGEHQDDFCVEFCTGLKDKNGKLIFEGDIVKTDIGAIGVVVFFEAQFAVRFENAFYCSVAEAKEIIGNIHEMESEVKE